MIHPIELSASNKPVGVAVWELDFGRSGRITGNSSLTRFLGLGTNRRQTRSWQTKLLSSGQRAPQFMLRAIIAKRELRSASSALAPRQKNR